MESWHGLSGTLTLARQVGFAYQDLLQEPQLPEPCRPPPSTAQRLRRNHVALYVTSRPSFSDFTRPAFLSLPTRV